MAKTRIRRNGETDWFDLSRRDTVTLQLVFVACCVLISVVQFFGARDTAVDLAQLLGFALIAAATLLALFGPDAQRSPGWSFLLLPSLDFLGVALLRLLHTDWGGASLLLLALLLIPTHWLGANPQARGVYLSIPLAALAIIPELNLLVTEAIDGATSAILHVALFPLLTLTGAFIFRTARGTINRDRWSGETFSSSRKLAHAGEIETSRLLATVLDSVDAGIVVFGPELKPFVMNHWIRERLARRGPGTDPWRTLLELVPLQPDRKTPFLAEHNPLTRGAGGEIISGEVFWLGENHADQVAVSLSTSPVKNGWQQGRAGILLVFTDVTIFLEALEKRDAFVGTVSHELRTPLTTILGYLELVLDEGATLSATTIGYLKKISDNANRQLMLVNDLLEVAKARSGDLVLSYEKVDLGFLAIEAVKNARASIEAKKMKVTIESDHTLCHLDPRRMGEVVENLLSNAVRYTPAGGRITLTTATVPTRKNSARKVRLTVSDNGMGIPPSDQPNLFTEFFRAENARTAAVPGAGLGLFIVKKIVDAHHGTITVDSALGTGTTITIELPCEPPAPEASLAM